MGRKQAGASRPRSPRWFRSAVLPIVLLGHACSDSTTDSTPPRILAVEPAPGADDVSLMPTISVEFDESIDPVSINAQSVCISSSARIVDCRIDCSDRTAFARPIRPLADRATYTVTVRTEVCDLAQNPLPEEFTWHFTTRAHPDVTAPAVDSIKPKNGATDMPVTTRIVIQFSEPVDPATIDKSTVTLTGADVSGALACTYHPSGSELTVMPTDPLQYHTRHVVRLNEGIRDLAGNPLERSVTSEFTTAREPDLAPPVVIGAAPTAGATGVARVENIRVMFDEVVDPASVHDASIRLVPDAPGTIECRGREIVLHPDRLLAPDTPYVATLLPGIADPLGNATVLPHVWSFRTGARLAWANAYMLDHTQGAAIRALPEGGCVVVGVAAGVTPAPALWVLRLDLKGEAIWERAYGGDAHAHDIEPTADGGLVVAGGSWSTGTDGSEDGWILKLAGNGSVEWQLAYGSAGVDQRIHSVRQTPDGGYIAAGDWTVSCCTTAWLMKLSPHGAIEWQRRYGEDGIHSAAAVIPVATSAGYLLVGRAEPPGGDSDAWLVRVAPNGELLWQVGLGGLGTADRAEAVIETVDGRFVFVGTTESFGAGREDVWVAHIETDGRAGRQIAYGAAGDERGHDILATSDGGLVIVGESSSFGGGRIDAWALELDATGTIRWQYAYGGSHHERAVSVAPAAETGITLLVNAEAALCVMRTQASGELPFDPTSRMFVTPTTAGAHLRNTYLGPTEAMVREVDLIARPTDAPAVETHAVVVALTPPF